MVGVGVIVGIAEMRQFVENPIAIDQCELTSVGQV